MYKLFAAILIAMLAQNAVADVIPEGELCKLLACVWASAQSQLAIVYPSAHAKLHRRFHPWYSRRELSYFKYPRLTLTSFYNY